MSSRLGQRALRLQRIARVGDTLAKVAEGDWAQRLADVRAQQERLGVVTNYCQDYAQLSSEREVISRDVLDWRRFREFSTWLYKVSVDQEREVSQAEFLSDAAAEHAAQKRGFARALQHVADRASQQSAHQVAVEEQQSLEALWRPKDQ